jgi:hypothetical protein
MSFLKRSVKNTYRDGQTRGTSSFQHLTEDQLETHLRIAKYGNFTLTDAVRPSYDLQIVPKLGFRHDKFRDDETGVEIPVVMGAATREFVYDLFIDLLDPLGEQVDVVLEASHDCEHGGHHDLVRESIDMPVLKSVLWDYEDVLLDDGCTGIAVLNPSLQMEVQFDEHKLLVAYGEDLKAFENIFADYNVPCHEELRFIAEAEHVHSSSEEFVARFQAMRYDLGIDC